MLAEIVIVPTKKQRMKEKRVLGLYLTEFLFPFFCILSCRFKKKLVPFFDDAIVATDGLWRDNIDDQRAFFLFYAYGSYPFY